MWGGVRRARASARARVYSRVITLVYVLPFDGRRERDAGGEAPTCFSYDESPFFVTESRVRLAGKTSGSLGDPREPRRPPISFTAHQGGRAGAAACEARRFPRPRLGRDVVEDRQATGTRPDSLAREASACAVPSSPFTADRDIANPVSGAPAPARREAREDGLPRGSRGDEVVGRASDDTARVVASLRTFPTDALRLPSSPFRDPPAFRSRLAFSKSARVTTPRAR